MFHFSFMLPPVSPASFTLTPENWAALLGFAIANHWHPPLTRVIGIEQHLVEKQVVLISVLSDTWETSWSFPPLTFTGELEWVPPPQHPVFLPSTYHVSLFYGESWTFASPVEHGGPLFYFLPIQCNDLNNYGVQSFYSCMVFQDILNGEWRPLVHSDQVCGWDQWRPDRISNTGFVPGFIDSKIPFGVRCHCLEFDVPSDSVGRRTSGPGSLRDSPEQLYDRVLPNAVKRGFLSHHSQSCRLIATDLSDLVITAPEDTDLWSGLDLSLPITSMRFRVLSGRPFMGFLYFWWSDDHVVEYAVPLYSDVDSFRVLLLVRNQASNLFLFTFHDDQYDYPEFEYYPTPFDAGKFPSKCVYRYWPAYGPLITHLSVTQVAVSIQ